MNSLQLLDPEAMLRQVAERVPEGLRANVVVIGSIASAWAFRALSGKNAVATKDIDLLLRPAINAVATAEALGQQLLDEGWIPQYPNGISPGTAATPTADLPALRLRPPTGTDHWFVELLAEPGPDQDVRRAWRPFATQSGVFGLPSFRFLPVAVNGPEETPFNLRVARPSRMALAHLLEHAQPDATPISSLSGQPPRFTKDVGRAIALWWLARQASPLAGAQWHEEWHATLIELYPLRVQAMRKAARDGLVSVDALLRETHALAMNSVLAPHGTTLDAFSRAYASLTEFIIDQL